MITFKKCCLGLIKMNSIILKKCIWALNMNTASRVYIHIYIVFFDISRVKSDKKVHNKFNTKKLQLKKYILLNKFTFAVVVQFL